MSSEKVKHATGVRQSGLHGHAALTFDDGPDPVWTPRVLDALSCVDATATFFVISPLALRHPELVHQIVEAGHAVELHCTRHVRHTQATREEIEADTREGLRALRSLGIAPRLWRPPWGVFAPWTREVARQFGLRTVGWTADTHDWRGDTAGEMLANIGPALGPGAVVLMHDGLGPGARRDGCGETEALIPSLVELLRSLGCEPATLAGRSGRAIA